MKRCPYCEHENESSFAKECEACNQPLDEQSEPSLQPVGTREEEPAQVTAYAESSTQSQDDEMLDGEPFEALGEQPQSDREDSRPDLEEPEQVLLPDVFAHESETGPSLDDLFDSVQEESASGDRQYPGYEQPLARDVYQDQRSRSEATVPRIARRLPPGALLVGRVVNAETEQRRYPPDWAKVTFWVALVVAVTPLFAALGIVGAYCSCFGSGLIAVMGFVLAAFWSTKQRQIPVLSLQVEDGENPRRIVPVFVIEPTAGSRIGTNYEVAVYGQWYRQQIRAHRIAILAAPDPTTGLLRASSGEIDGRRVFHTAAAAGMVIGAVAVWIAVMSFLGDLFA